MPAKQLPVSRKDKPDSIDIHVVGRVWLRRVLLGLSQGKLGKAVGVTFQQLQKYESGANRIGASRLYALSRVLDVPPAFFFEDMPPEISGKGGKPVPGPAERNQEAFLADLPVRRETLKLVRAYYRIKDPNVRKRLFNLAKSMAVLGE